MPSLTVSVNSTVISHQRSIFSSVLLESWLVVNDRKNKGGPQPNTDDSHRYERSSKPPSNNSSESVLGVQADVHVLVHVSHVMT